MLMTSQTKDLSHIFLLTIGQWSIVWEGWEEAFHSSPRKVLQHLLLFLPSKMYIKSTFDLTFCPGKQKRWIQTNSGDSGVLSRKWLEKALIAWSPEAFAGHRFLRQLTNGQSYERVGQLVCEWGRERWKVKVHRWHKEGLLSHLPVQVALLTWRCAGGQCRPPPLCLQYSPVSLSTWLPEY